MGTKQLIEHLQNRVSDLEMENQKLHEPVDFLTKKLYGKSCEKTSALAKDQVSLFDEAEIETNPNASEPDLKEVQSYRRKKFKGQRAELLKDIPHEKKLCTLVKEDQFCEQCGDDLISVGEEFIRTEIEFIPAMPYPVIQHSMASPSTVAWVMHQKFVNAIPLYRQEQEWKMLDVKLSRATMANWLIVATRDWLIPLVDLMHKNLLAENHLHVDETTIQVMKEKERKNTTDSYMWVYTTGTHGIHPMRIFEYQPGRSGKYPQAFLKGFKGFIHTDAYAGYNQVPNVTRYFCWAHLRRKFVDALPKDLQAPKAAIPSQGIRFCNQLFQIEKQLETLTSKERKNERLKQEKPVLEAFWSWVESTLASGSILPKSKLITALKYAMNQKEGFMNYLLDGDCSISNNLAENSIRPFTIGRKNWLFSGSPRGAKTSAAIYSMIETAKANGIPYKYLNFIFSELPGVQFEVHPEFLEDYLPWNEGVQQLCK